MPKKNKIKGWAIIDEEGNLLSYDRAFQDVFHIHRTKVKARNAREVASSHKSSGLEVVACEITYFIPRK
jgi:hypothetical protein